jgi:hypothetical protein
VAEQESDADTTDQWKRRLKEYSAQLDLLRDSLSDEDLSFFAAPDALHDAELIDMIILDGSRPAPLSDPPRPWILPGNHPVQVKLRLLDADEALLWTLAYTGVRRILVDFPSDSPFRYNDGEGFGDWGYHELSAARDGFLQHEMLFASGSTLLLECRRIEVTRTKARPQVTP